HAPQDPLVLLRVEPIADALPIFARKVHQVLVVEDDLALRELRIPREEGHHRQAHGGLPAPAFSRNPEDLAPTYAQVDSIQRLVDSAPRTELDVELANHGRV